MQVLKANVTAPCLRSVLYCERFAEAPRAVLDNVLLWHAQLRLAQRSDVFLLDGEEQLVWAEGWPNDTHECPVLGALLWTPQDDGSWWTELGFVEPRYRKQGVYRLLWEACVYKAQLKNVRSIQGGVAIGNAPMHATCEKLGRRPTYTVYDYEVPRD